MTWYTVYRIADGTVVSGTRNLANIANEARLADLGMAVAQDATRNDGNAPWDPVNHVYLSPPPAQSIISPREFSYRFTVAELAGILASSDNVVKQIVFYMQLPGEIDLVDQKTVAALTYLATHPAATPLLTPARATAIGTP